MQVIVDFQGEQTITFDEDEFTNLSESEKRELINIAVKKIVSEQVSWSEIKEIVRI